MAFLTRRKNRLMWQLFIRASCVNAGIPHGVSLWDECATHTGRYEQTAELFETLNLKD